MDRRPTTQDISWLLDLDRNKQLDLEPPYQRKSVWTRKDRQFFLDTIFRNFPSPSIFLHKTINEKGKTTYHVVDGKQRTQTILDFAADTLRLPSYFGDKRLDGKKWSDLQGDTDLKRLFWNYQITIEMIDVVEEQLVNDVFDRLNRNARKLTAQELRHAKYDGWFINEAEQETAREEWRELGVSTAARSKRMADTQFISELMLVVLEKQLLGFDQDSLDSYYAKYDEPDGSEVTVDPVVFQEQFGKVRRILVGLEERNGSISKAARAIGNIYTLWGVLALADRLPTKPQLRRLAEKYQKFMAQVAELTEKEELDAFIRTDEKEKYAAAFKYLTNLRGANTDLGPRRERHEALKAALFG